MNLTILPPAMGNEKGRLGSLTWQSVKEKENTNFKPVVDLVRNELCLAIFAHGTLHN